jgi:hypothetical protein
VRLNLITKQLTINWLTWPAFILKSCEIRLKPEEFHWQRPPKEFITLRLLSPHNKLIIVEKNVYFKSEFLKNVFLLSFIIIKGETLYANDEYVCRSSGYCIS